MCGIVGYVGPRNVEGLLLESLERLEYRGYDSCGIAVLNNGTAKLTRAQGRILGLIQRVNGDASLEAHGLPNGGAAANGGDPSNGHGPSNGDVPTLRCGIGHTRWATHGRPSENNAHPHADCSGSFLVAHNGIIENFGELKKRLSKEGHAFRTETDTEVLPHLVEKHFAGNLETAVRAALGEVEGMYGCVFVSPRDKLKIVAARQGAPLVIGVGEGENFVASDAAALLAYTSDLIFLEDGEIAVVRADGVELFDSGGSRVRRLPRRVEWTAEAAEKQGYSHFMLKEIHEQPQALRDTLAGRVRADGKIELEEEADILAHCDAVDRVNIVACGTSLHAGLIGKFLIERFARLPVEVDYASEFRYREPVIDDGALVIGISQSGETADTVAALEEARARGASLFTICNVVGSSIARLSDGVLYTHAGLEIGVASTKSFLTQVTALELIALELARSRGTLEPEEVRRRALALRRVPDLIEDMLADTSAIEAMAERLAEFENCLYLGRGINYPVAIEGALKLKEIAYIHAEGYPAGEMKHGPIALISDQMCVLAVAPRDSVYRKTMSNVEETIVRDGRVLGVATYGDEEMPAKAEQTVFVPDVEPWLSPLVTTVPMQLLAFHAGILRGCDVDKPRNLAKSVTVE
ncbi:MAG TPA: glutamine--fructose-6-phosphate transaminase (isomerizing) [Acidobacteriota bacterium]